MVGRLIEGELAAEQELGVAWRWKWLRINSVACWLAFGTTRHHTLDIVNSHSINQTANSSQNCGL